jgi:magnesium chelatase subunit I
VKRRLAFEHDPLAFVEAYAASESAMTMRLRDARSRLRDVAISDAAVGRTAALCQALGTDGLRGELTLIRAARAAASLDGATEVGDSHVRRVATLALRHRLRRNPLDEAGSTVRVEKAVAQVFGS